MDNLFTFLLGAGAIVGAQILYKLYWRRWGEGSPHAYIYDREKPEGAYRIVRKIKTPTQKIALVERQGETWVYSNGELMFSTTEDENMYAEALVHVPMSAARKVQHVLIIGGGGGVTTREALKYPEVESVTVVDIDEIMMNFGKKVEGLVRFNQGALNHSKVETVIADGREFVEKRNRQWDVIIVDLPEPTERCPSLSRLFSLEFYMLLRRSLKPGGAVAVACSASSWMPEYFGCIQATLRKAGFHSLPYHLDYIVDSGEDWALCLATEALIESKDLKMKVETRHLTEERLKDMFHMPLYFSSIDKDARIQTDTNRVLIDIVREAY
ncbi:spermidine synthase [Cohnella kolymensis]|uniref:Polyamine aminopropyltransferase n=1 Tax=Cohnella kolymensis TaxID=1590652 RepID=A0ABR5A6E2_9BACL|nr:spermidine synthase [Cohnella kolymensis]KIL36611.1 spermidine synthase [Cohnella kolymensis]